MPFPTFRLLLGLSSVLSAVAPIREVHAEHAGKLFLGPEVRARPHDEGTTVAPRYEVALPHGLVSESGTTSFVARWGLVIPARGAPVAIPATVGLRYAPLQTTIRPLFGADIGGYLVVARGLRENESPNGPELCWSTRALAGLAIFLAPSVALLVYADAMWAQIPRDERSRDYVSSNMGGGVELRVAFAPRLRVVDMVLRGTAAPKGF